MNNCYASVGFLGKSSDIELLERILLYNYETIIQTKKNLET